jgi:hypothetical protein
MKPTTKKPTTKKPATKKPTTKKSTKKLAIEAAAGLPIMPAMASAVVAGVRLDEISRLFVEHRGQLHHVVCDAGVYVDADSVG